MRIINIPWILKGYNILWSMIHGDMFPTLIWQEPSSAVFVVACLCCSKLIISLSLSVDVAFLCLLFSYQHCFFFSPPDSGRGRGCRRCWQHPWWPGAPSGSAVQTWSPRPRTRPRGPGRRGTIRRADAPLVFSNFDINRKFTLSQIYKIKTDNISWNWDICLQIFSFVGSKMDLC